MESKDIRIVQISDCHLPADRSQGYRQINPHENLQTLMRKVSALKPDLLLATGDLSEDGSVTSYRTLQGIFNPLRVPVLALPGNHDDPGLLADAFPGSPVDTISVSEHGSWRIIRLNSTIPGKPEGRIDEGTLDELEGFLAHNDQLPCLLALHHQPVMIGSPWIDKYPLVEPEGLLGLIDRYSHVKAVVWGHIHQVFEADRNGTAMLGGPSSAINGLRDTQKFTADTGGPAFRWLKLEKGGSLGSGIIHG
jgi:Icc protein